AKLRATAPDDTEVMQLTVPGSVAFRLYDTYGFPLDLTVDLAREQGMAVDIEGFDAAMAEQRVVSRGGAAFRDSGRERNALYVERVSTTEFLGYTETEADATILALLDPNGFVETAEAGDEIEIILDRTPFYGESGGQIGDKGEIRTETGVVSIDDTFRPTPTLFVHRGVVAEGFIKVGETAHASIDVARRMAIRRNHTATHLLHKALREVLGTDTHQAGSLVAPDRLRFDFTSLDSMTPAQLARVGEIVSEQVLASIPVETQVLPYAEAVEGGAMALFGEKYGDTVRVVSIGDFSKELCGGTHLQHTGQIGPFAIVSEGSVAAGVRRIEAVTGTAAIERGMRQQAVLDTLARDFRSPWSELPDQVAQLREKLKATEREVGKLRAEIAAASVGDLIESKVEVDGIVVVAGRVSASEKGDLRTAGDRLRDKLGSGVVVLGAEIDGKPSLIALVTPDAVGKGINAGDLVRESAKHIDGRGGGRPDLAEAGGKDASGLDIALAGVPALVQSLLNAK
ncbi:MAG: alanine--tRNA ligase, partial [Thermomicrobiales bacterium]|nr:alanine--tRNA ligase [Thermomicrobiales bacterium]